MKKSRLFAPFLMLFAGAVASITMLAFHYTAGQMLPRLLAVLLIFYVAGCFIQKRVLTFMNQIREKEEEMEREAAALEEEASAGETRAEGEDSEEENA